MSSTKPTRPAHLKVRPMEVADQNEVAALFVETFKREPLGAKHGVQMVEGLWIAAKAIQDPISFVVEDQTLPVGHRLVAFRTSCLLTAASLQKESTSEKATDPVQGFLDYMMEAWQKKTTLLTSHPHAKVMKFLALGVDIRYEGMGLAKDLLKMAMDKAQEQKCDGVVVIASAFATQHLFGNRLGFERMARVPYRDFEWEGGHPFKDIVEPEFLEVYEKKLMDHSSV